MHNSQTIADLTDEELREELRKLATEYFGTDRFKTMLADEIGLTRNTVNVWFMDGRPQTIALLYLQSRLEQQRLQGICNQIGAAFRTLNTL